MDERLIWIDLETTGLDPRKELIVEVGVLITDLELNGIRGFQQTIWSPAHDNRLAEMRTSQDEGDKFVVGMHEKSVLWVDAIAEANKIENVSAQLVEWLKASGISKDEPMCGSSVQFDRNFLNVHMPEVHDLFSYRNIDISTIKEVCRRYNPAIFAGLDDVWRDQDKRHRVMADIYDTVVEFKYYRDEFLFWKD